METDWSGTFGVEIGNTGISVFEAGYPHRTLFGDAPIGLCEMIVFGRKETLGARIVDSEYFPRQIRFSYTKKKIFRTTWARPTPAGLLRPAMANWSHDGFGDSRADLPY